jgi:hypothetical protein
MRKYVVVFFLAVKFFFVLMVFPKSEPLTCGRAGVKGVTGETNCQARAILPARNKESGKTLKPDYAVPKIKPSVTDTLEGYRLEGWPCPFFSIQK